MSRSNESEVENSSQVEDLNNSGDSDEVKKI